MMKKQSKKSVIAFYIENEIYTIHGKRVMLDADLAKIYGVETKILNQSIRRNKERFPKDFMFKLTIEEFANLRSQIVTSSYGGRRYTPFVFTEHGAVMLASVLRSKHAVQMSIEVVKVFVRFRHILTSQKNAEKQLTEIRSFILKKFSKVDQDFKRVWNAIENLINPEEQPKKPIGFKIDSE